MPERLAQQEETTRQYVGAKFVVFKLTADGKILCAWGGDFVTKDSLYRFLYAAVVP